MGDVQFEEARDARARERRERRVRRGVRCILIDGCVGSRSREKGEGRRREERDAGENKGETVSQECK